MAERRAATGIALDAAVDAARTGDVWVFRGRSNADRAIRIATNAPVNHVGMAVVLEDLPPMMWHAELGRSLTDLWTGDHHRGVQLHDLRAAVERWTLTYGQDAWMRQLTPEVHAAQEDAVLRTIARWDGTAFPTTATLGLRWLRGRRWSMPQITFPGRAVAHRTQAAQGMQPASMQTQAAAYCAEVVAVTYEAMGLLEPGRPANWYDPGRFWSGDHLRLADGWSLGAEIAVRLPGAVPTGGPAARRASEFRLSPRQRLAAQWRRLPRS
ncbi:MAG: hypothetical protein Q4P32_09800 [Micrococcales bacterium]|nr:hypothetical protein [Micrococcales bacterium]